MKTKHFALVLSIFLSMIIFSAAQADPIRSLQRITSITENACLSGNHFGSFLPSAVDAAEDYFILKTNLYVRMPAGMFRFSSDTDIDVWKGTGLSDNIVAMSFARMDSFEELGTWKKALKLAGYSTSSKKINGFPFVFGTRYSDNMLDSQHLFDTIFLYNYLGNTYAIASAGNDKEHVLSMGSIVNTIKARAQEINVNATSLLLYPSQSFSLFPSSEGIDADFGFYSSKSSVAYVDSNTGVVTAKKAGSAKIYVISSSGSQILIKVTVKAAPSIKNLKSSYRISRKSIYQLQPKVSVNSNATIRQILFTYSSSNPSVALVNDQGQIIPVSRGTTYITVKANTGSIKRIKVQVK